MLKVGLTGGIGSGKTTVCNVFRHLGIPVYHADIHARILSEVDGDIKKALSGLVGDDIYTESGLNRKKLSQMIFVNRSLLQKVNEIIHPKVLEHFSKWINEHLETNYIIHEAAILFESGMNPLFDKIITVSAPEDTRISRIMKRDGVTENDVKNIIKNQWPESRKRNISDYIIINDQKQMILPQILKIHNELTFLIK
jgi:dephospho-CoA kinase